MARTYRQQHAAARQGNNRRSIKQSDKSVGMHTPGRKTFLSVALLSLLAAPSVFAAGVQISNSTQLRPVGSLQLIDFGTVSTPSVSISGTYQPAAPNDRFLLTLNIDSTKPNPFSLTLTALTITNPNPSGTDEFVVASEWLQNGDAVSNQLLIDGLTTNLSGVTKITGGYSENGSANQNKVVFNTPAVNRWASGDISGGYALEGGDANNNSVTVSGDVALTGVSGGEIRGHSKPLYSADANEVLITASGSIDNIYGGNVSSYGNSSNNTVDVTFTGDTKNIAGGKAYDEGDSSNNTVTIRSASSLTVSERLEGGHNKFANNNIVTIEQGAGAQIKALYGGYASNWQGSADSNKVNILGGTQIDEIAGGFNDVNSAGGATARENIVTIDAPNLKIGKVVGGASNTALLNRVIIKNATAGEVYGGKTNSTTSGTASQNFVYLENAEGSSVYGGFSGKEAVKNTVLINNSTINGNGGAVYGGYVSRRGTAATDNIVQINGTSSIDGDVYGAYSAKTDIGPQLTRNSVSLNGDITVTGGVYAAAADGNGPIGDKNALVFGGKVKAGTIGGFNDLHLLVGDANLVSGGGDYILTITGTDSLDLTGKNIDIYDKRGNPTAPAGEKFGLIKLAAAQGAASPGIQLAGNVTLHNTFVDKDWKLKTENAGELYIMDGKLMIQPPASNNPSSNPSNPIVVTPTTTANVNSESLSQNRLSSIASANQSAQFAADSGLSAMKDQLYGKNWFFAGEGGMNKYGHGFNKIELNGGSVITGMMNNFDGTLLGGFFEASWGHASSKENVFSAKSNIQSYGVGVLASREIYPNWEVDGSLRFGWMRNSFKGRYFDVDGSSDFKTNMAYVSGHIGTAYNFSVSDETTISPYARYIVSYLGSDKVNAGSVEEDLYKANATVSHTLRAGVKVNTQISENFKFVGGVAVDETMGAKAKGRVSGYDLKTLSVNGTTAVGELKLQAVPTSTSPWKFELGVNGYAGKRRGFSGEASVNYSF